MCCVDRFFLLVLTTAGCTSAYLASNPKPASAEANESVRVESEQGPVRLTAEASPRNARVSDDVSLRIVVESEIGVDVSDPTIDDQQSDFLVSEGAQPLPRRSDGRNVVEKQYTLEPLSTGDLAIPAFKVTFSDRRSGAKPEEQAITSGELRVHVASDWEGKVDSLDRLHPAEGPIALTNIPWGLTFWGLGLAASLLLAAIILRYLRRHKKRSRVLSPSERATLELEALLKSGCRERDVKQFFVELSGIVRRYLERVTEIRVAEQTTEEFLRTIQGNPSFAGETRDRLQRFLASADLVKFAGYRPDSLVIESSVARARELVQARAEVAE